MSSAACGLALVLAVMLAIVHAKPLPDAINANSIDDWLMSGLKPFLGDSRELAGYGREERSSYRRPGRRYNCIFGRVSIDELLSFLKNGRLCGQRMPKIRKKM
ncbi:hypothetical protein LSAT2_025922 [Lamellibrachia satsuma]|nr:hypothetical protein LSAT2_025922 [Lamellibrachia satsuma]